MKNITVAILFIGTLVLFGCASQNSTATTTTTVPITGPTASISIASLVFSPAALTISAETTVTWTNNDSVTHTVTSTSGPVSFDSGLLSPGSAYSFKFSTAGSYSYRCEIHTSMVAAVTAQ